MKGSSVYVTFDARQLKSDVGDILDRKIRAVRSDEGVYFNILEIMADLSEQYVPKKTGALRSSAEPTKQGLRYRAINENSYDGKGYNYAGIQWDNDEYDHTSPESDHWVNVMLAERYDEFADRVASALAKKLNEV